MSVRVRFTLRDGFLTLPDSDSDFDAKNNGYIALCRSFHNVRSQIQTSILTGNYRNGIWIPVCTWVRLQQCKWTLKVNIYYWSLPTLGQHGKQVEVPLNPSKSDIAFTAAFAQYKQTFKDHGNVHLRPLSFTTTSVNRPHAMEIFALYFRPDLNTNCGFYVLVCNDSGRKPRVAVDDRLIV